MKKSGFIMMLWMVALLGFASPPPADEVFKVSASPVDPNTFVLNWQIKKGFFLYADRVKLVEPNNANFHLGQILFPKAIKRTDALGKSYLIYRNQLVLPVAILGNTPGEALVAVHFQGCSDDGFCYPPETQNLRLGIDKNLELSEVSLEANDVYPEIKTASSENDKLRALFSTHNWWLITISFFGFGLLLSFTPCILPMVPVLSGIIVGHGADLSTRKAFFLSLCYVLSMSLTYALVGAIVAMMGNNLQIVMQSPWSVGLFSVIFVLLALSMFGWYELKLPVALQAKLANITRGQSGGHYLGTAVMGCLSTLILSPCVTAPLIGALGYIAQSGDVLMGCLSLFFLSLGMGTPLLMIGTSAGKLLPKAGHWMNTVKSFFGVMLLGVAIYLLERLLPSVLVMGLWASLLIFSGLFLGALSRTETLGGRWSQGFGIIFLAYGLLVLIGASQGHDNPLVPLASLQQVDSSSFHEQVVTSVPEVQQAIKEAKGKPVMLDFYADWCASCKVIAKTTLQDQKVRGALKDFVVIKVDLSANDANTKALLQNYHVVAPPTFLFFDAMGKELPKLRLVGEASAHSFYTNLDETLKS